MSKELSWAEAHEAYADGFEVESSPDGKTCWLPFLLPARKTAHFRLKPLKVHPCALAIKAWARGRQVQFQMKDTGHWIQCENPTFDSTYRYRVYGDPIYSRRYLQRNEYDQVVVDIVSSEEPEKILNLSIIEEEEGFIGWLDKQWVETIPVEECGGE